MMKSQRHPPSQTPVHGEMLLKQQPAVGIGRVIALVVRKNSCSLSYQAIFMVQSTQHRVSLVGSNLLRIGFQSGASYADLSIG